MGTDTRKYYSWQSTFPQTILLFLHQKCLLSIASFFSPYLTRSFQPFQKLSIFKKQQEIIRVLDDEVMLMRRMNKKNPARF